MGLEKQLSILGQNHYNIIFNLGPTLNVEVTKQEDLKPEALLVMDLTITYYAIPLTDNRIPTFFDIRNSQAFNGSAKNYVKARFEVLANLGASLDELELYESQIKDDARMNEEQFNRIKQRTVKPLALFFGSINEGILREIEQKYIGWKLLEALSEKYHHDLKRDAECIDHMINNSGYQLIPEKPNIPGISVSQDLADNLREAADIYLRISSHAYNEAQRTKNRHQELSEMYHQQKNDFATKLRILEEKTFKYFNLRGLAEK